MPAPLPQPSRPPADQLTERYTAEAGRITLSGLQALVPDGRSEAGREGRAHQLRAAHYAFAVEIIADEFPAPPPQAP